MSKLGFYVPFNSHCHVGTDPQYCHLWESNELFSDKKSFLPYSVPFLMIHVRIWQPDCISPKILTWDTEKTYGDYTGKSEKFLNWVITCNL